MEYLPRFDLAAEYQALSLDLHRTMKNFLFNDTVWVIFHLHVAISEMVNFMMI